MKNRAVKSLCVSIIAVLTTVGCGSDSSSFSILPDAQFFQQSVNTKIDVLWVVDNSGSMHTSQQNVKDNFNSFINNFLDKSFDFRIAVTTTDSYLGLPQWNNGTEDLTLSRWRDGADGNHSGVFVIDNNTPNLTETFQTNVVQGINGWGDERAFLSFHTALNNPTNDDFLREDSFLAIIIVADEDDFSHDGTEHLGGNPPDYSHPALHPVQSYVDYLDQLTGSAELSSRRFNVSSIGIPDQACLDQVGAGRQIAHRINELADLTEGVKGSICENFATTLDEISNNIAELATKFPLDREPIPETITVFVNGENVPNANENPSGDGGWIYEAESISIKFLGENYIPPQGAFITVDFDPVGLDL